MARTLVVNADDFGFSNDVNAGIVHSHRAGILTATTLMANGGRFDEAVRLAHATPTLDIGVHFVLVQGPSLSQPGTDLPGTITELITALARGRLNIREELRLQADRICRAGLQPVHCDTHKHTHLHPAVLDAVARTAAEFGIRYIRRPFDLPLTEPIQEVRWTKRALSRGLHFLRRRMHRVIESHGCRTTDHFAGFQVTGLFGPPELARLLRHLPDGVTEFMTHPGYCTDELRALPTRLKESRQRELDALCAAEVRQVLTVGGVRLTGYRGLLQTG